MVVQDQFIGEDGLGIQVDGDNNSVTIFSTSSKLSIDRPHTRRTSIAPANERQLRLTERRATTLVGRHEELGELATWRDSPAVVAVRCLTGRAGSGKTRLAIEAMRGGRVRGVAFRLQARSATLSGGLADDRRAASRPASRMAAARRE
jgi:hypothetical protein